MVWGAVGMALILLIAGILDKFANAPGPNQRAYGAGVATMVSSILQPSGRPGSRHHGFTPLKSSLSMSEPKEEPGRSSVGRLATVWSQ